MKAPLIKIEQMDSAIIGIGYQNNNIMYVYDYEKCIKILMKNKMSREEAEEYFDYKIISIQLKNFASPVFVNTKYYNEELN